jgi:hypothetical protein
MEFKDSNIYRVFLNEFSTLVKSTNSEINYSNTSYIKFIQMKDLGIICLSWSAAAYTVIDEKKWLLSKIKYGL